MRTNVIILVGVAHVINIRSQIERLIMHENPEVVAVELDYGRFVALQQKDRDNEVQHMPYIYRKMAEMQQDLAKMLGTEVGDEMLTAVRTATALRKKVAFIDMDSATIMKEIKRNMSLWEKIKLTFSFLLVPFIGKKAGKKEIEDVINQEEYYISELKKRYPGLAKALFDRREEYMAARLKELSEKYGTVMAFVGDGHIDGLQRRLKDVKMVRLRDMLGHTVSYSIEIAVK